MRKCRQTGISTTTVPVSNADKLPSCSSA